MVIWPHFMISDCYLGAICCKTGIDALSGVTGGRAPSFRGLSVGETAAPPKVENAGGGRTPPQISRRKDQPGRLGTKEKASMTAGTVTNVTMQTLLNVTNK